jgi:hypothetical protein
MRRLRRVCSALWPAPDRGGRQAPVSRDGSRGVVGGAGGSTRGRGGGNRAVPRLGLTQRHPARVHIRIAALTGKPRSVSP